MGKTDSIERLAKDYVCLDCGRRMNAPRGQGMQGRQAHRDHAASSKIGTF